MNDPAAIKAGKEFFVTICSVCHGPNGEGGRGPNLIDGHNVRQATNQQIFDAIKNGVAGGDMPPLRLPDEQIRNIVAYVRYLAAPAYLQNVPGTPEMGRTLFFGDARCIDCHAIRGRGGHRGPDLTNIGASRNQNQLQEALLRPNARISDGFTPVRVTTREGEQISGVAKNRSNYSLQMLDTEGQLRLFLSQELREVVYLDKTWMPDDYGEQLTAEEVQDLLAFLSRQALRTPELDHQEDP